MALRDAARCKVRAARQGTQRKSRMHAARRSRAPGVPPLLCCRHQGRPPSAQLQGWAGWRTSPRSWRPRQPARVSLAPWPARKRRQLDRAPCWRSRYGLCSLHCQDVPLDESSWRLNRACYLLECRNADSDGDEVLFRPSEALSLGRSRHFPTEQALACPAWDLYTCVSPRS